MSTNRPKTRGPPADRVKITGDWKKAVGHALQKPVPKDGWPDAPKRYKVRKNKAGK